MIKVIIVEDEINVSQALEKMLKMIVPNIEVVAKTGFVDEAISLINIHKPALIFMDIELEDGTGFDVLDKLENNVSRLIFTTAYNQYAIKAFKFSAIDYLLKPLDPLELQKAVQRALKSINLDIEHQELLEVLKSNLKKEGQKIVLKTTEQRYVIDVEEIIRLEADGAYTLFVTTKNKIIVSKNLKYYQDILDTAIFVRSHQSHLINKNHIKSITKNNKLLMSNADLVVISTRKKHEIMQLISDL